MRQCRILQNFISLATCVDVAATTLKSLTVHEGANRCARGRYQMTVRRGPLCTLRCEPGRGYSLALLVACGGPPQSSAPFESTDTFAPPRFLNFNELCGSNAFIFCLRSASASRHEHHCRTVDHLRRQGLPMSRPVRPSSYPTWMMRSVSARKTAALSNRLELDSCWLK